MLKTIYVSLAISTSVFTVRDILTAPTTADPVIAALVFLKTMAVMGALSNFNNLEPEIYWTVAVGIELAWSMYTILTAPLREFYNYVIAADFIMLALMVFKVGIVLARQAERVKESKIVFIYDVECPPDTKPRMIDDCFNLDTNGAIELIVEK
jgi:hypothetical protein